MAGLDKKNYPYPVLAHGRDDYNDECSFEIRFFEDEIVVTEKYIEIPVSYELICSSLEKMILAKRAQVVVKINSRSANYSRLFIFEAETKKGKILIPKFDVIRSVELTGLIVACELVPKFSCAELNQLYFAGTTFSFQKGDFFAIDTTRKIYIDDSELEKPIASIFLINRGREQEEDIVVDFTDEKISINLSDDLNKMYWTLKDFNNGALRRYVMAAIVYPALIEAIEQIKNHYRGIEDENYSEKRWFRAIELKAQKHNIIMAEYGESSVTLADKLLGNIAMDALGSFKEMFEQEINNGEMQLIGGVD